MAFREGAARAAKVASLCVTCFHQSTQHNILHGVSQKADILDNEYSDNRSYLTPFKAASCDRVTKGKPDVLHMLESRARSACMPHEA